MLMSVMATEARLERMPQSVLRRICNFLPCNCSYLVLKHTCRRLHRLLSDHVTWASDTLRMCSGVHVTVPLWVMVRTSNPRLSRLDLCSCSTATDVFLIDLGPLCPTVRDVCLEDCSLVTDVGLVGLCRSIVRLEKLSIAGTKRISCESVATVMRMHASSIVNLNLSHAVGLRHDFYMLPVLLYHTLNLREFIFKWSKNLVGAPYSVQVSIGRFLQACPKLTHLNVACLPLQEHIWTLHTVVKSCSNIRHLDLKYSCITDENVFLVCRELLFLEYFDVSGSDKITDVGLNGIGTNLLLLSFLNLSDCVNVTDTGLRKALSKLCCLRDLLVRQCHRITDATLSSLRTICPKLQFLDASGTMMSASTLKQLQRITDPEILVVAEDCPHVLGLDNECWGDVPQNITNKQDRLRYGAVEL